MGTMNKLTKIVLSFLMVITCINFSTVQAEDGEEVNYSEPTTVETVSEDPANEVEQEVAQEEPAVEEATVEEAPAEQPAEEAAPVEEPQQEEVAPEASEEAQVEEATATPEEAASEETTEAAEPQQEETTATPEETQEEAKEEPAEVQKATVEISYVDEEDKEIADKVSDKEFDVDFVVTADDKEVYKDIDGYTFKEAIVNDDAENRTFTADTIKLDGLKVTSDMNKVKLVYSKNPVAVKKDTTAKKASKKSSGLLGALEKAVDTLTGKTEEASDDADPLPTSDETRLEEFFVVADRNTVTVGDTTKVSVTIKPDNYPTKDVTWTTSNSDVAEVDENGVVTTKKVGTVTITATLDSDKTVTSSTTIAVEAVKVNKITITGYTKKYLEKDETVPLGTTIEPEDAANKDIIWSSSNQEVATVDQNGVVTAAAQGTTTIQAKNEVSGVFGTQKITVYDSTPYTATVNVWVTNQNQKVSYNFYVAKDGTIVNVSDIKQNTSNKDGTVFVSSGDIRVIKTMSGTPSWASIQNYSTVQSFRYSNNRLQYTTDGSTWNDVRSGYSIYDFSAMQYNSAYDNAHNESDITVGIGDWPYGANDYTTHKKQTIQILLLDTEKLTTDGNPTEIYNSGKLRYDDDSSGDFGKINFNSENSKYEVTKVEVYRNDSKKKTYVKGSIPSNLTVSFSSQVENHYVIKAYVAAKTINVTYVATGATEGTIPEATTVKTINPVTVATQVPEKEGSIFVGWEYNGRTYRGGDSLEASSKDIVFTARFVPASEVINYTVNDSTMGSVSRTYERVGETVTSNLVGSTAIAKTGYKFVEWVNAAGEQVSTEVQFAPKVKTPTTYTAVFEPVKSDLIIHYVWIDSNNTSHEIKDAVTKSYAYGATWTEEAPEIPGYKKPSTTTQSGTKGVTTEEITFYYTQKEGKVVYNLGPKGSWGDGAPKNTAIFDAEKGKWAYTYGFDKGDTFVVTDKLPVSSDNAVFVGWYDKARDTTSAKMRKAGETVTYPYTKSSKTKSYTLDALWEKLSGKSHTVTYDGTPHNLAAFTVVFANDNLQGWTDSASSLVQASNIQYRVKQDDREANEWGDMPSFTDAGTYNIEARATVNGVVLTAEATLTINPRPVTFTGKSDRKTYNGQEQVVEGFTSTTGVEGEGLLADTTSNVEASARGTDVKEYTGTITAAAEVVLMHGEENVTGNYKITTTPGKLTITQSDQLSIKAKVEEDSRTKVYDGTALTGEAEADPAAGTKVEYTTDGGDTWTEEIPSITNAGTVHVTARATNSNYSNTPKVEYDLTVTQRPVTFTGKSDRKTYNGQEQVVEGFTSTTGVEGEGLLADTTSNVEASARGTDVKEYTGTITAAAEVVLMHGEENVTGNYKITTTPGKLTITQSDQLSIKAKVEEDSRTKVYDGTALTGEAEADPAAGTKVEYTTDGGDTWTEEIPSITNAGTVHVTARATNSNYSNTPKVEYDLTVTQRPVTLTSATDSKPYDGTPLTKPEVTVGGDGFAEGEGATFAVTGTITNVGTKANTFGYALNKNTLASNYNISTELGSLTITPKTITPDQPGTPEEEKTGITVENPGDVKYDGKDHAEKPVIKDEKTGVTLEEGKDYEIVYPEDIKNAGEITATVVGKGDYEGSFEIKFNILKRDVTFTSATDSKQYDGNALTNGNVEITGDGFIEGEGATFNVTGFITDVGSTNNAFTYAMNEGTNADNYNVTVVEGTLTVSEQPVVPTPVTPTTPSNNTPARTNNVPARAVTNPTTTTPAPEATVEPEKAETTPAPTAKPEKIKEEATPQAAPKGHWALINLIAAMLSVVLAVVALLAKHAKDEDKDDEDKDDQVVANENEDDDENESTRHRRWKVIATIDAILAVVVFILTENISLPMVLVDKWTLLMVLFGLISIVSTYFARKWHEEDEDEDEESSQNA